MSTPTAEKKKVCVVVIVAMQAHKYLSGSEWVLHHSISLALSLTYSKGADIDLKPPPPTSFIASEGRSWGILEFPDVLIWVSPFGCVGPSWLAFDAQPFGPVPPGSFINGSREFYQLYKRVVPYNRSRSAAGWCLVTVFIFFLHKDRLQVCVEAALRNRRVWQSRCRLPSLAGKQGSLWKMLSLHCGFTATMSTSTILVHLAVWSSRSS